jgi:benzylsuccinate CoA-transferase BbsF subunit
LRNLPLAGVRVADFTWIGAGAFTTKLLADFGAQVIKIESAERLDALRGSRPFRDGKPGVNRSGYFADRNSSKRGITINLKNPKGQEFARRLVAHSDVVANNFSPGVMEKFGLGYDAVRQIRPDIVYVSMSMQGAAGPEHKYLGFGLTIGALTGLQYLSGLPECEPAGTGTNFPDHIPNPCHAAFAVLAALFHRRRTGEGQFIDLAQTEPMISLLGPTILNYTVNGDLSERNGNTRLPRVPHGVYPCAGEDRWIAISAWTDQAWDSLIRILGFPNWADRELSSAEKRLARRQEIDAGIAEATRLRDADELTTALQSEGVPAGVVRSAADVILSDPQLRHRGHWVHLNHLEMGRSLYNAPPFRMSGVDAVPRTPAPLLGEHTAEVCREVFELADDEIVSLRQDGVLV